MNRKKIYSYFSVNFLFLFFFLQNVHAQEIENDSIAEKKSTSFFQGIYVGTDLFSPVSYLVGTDYISYQLHIQANLKNKFFPVWEIGVGRGDKTNEQELNLHTESALYNKIGLNYSMLKKNGDDFMYLGALVGFSSFSYSLNNFSFSSGYWGDNYTGNAADLNASVTWGELLGGIQVKVISNLYMGWNIAYKIKFKEKVDNTHIKPWYIPGYGTSQWGITYHVLYKIPFW